MTHKPELLHVIEQNERDKDARCVRLVDSNGVFALVIDEKYGERFAALWNMAERLGLATEEIKTKESMFSAAPDMLEALEEVVALTENLPVCPFCSCVLDHRPECLSHEIEAAIRKARGEE